MRRNYSNRNQPDFMRAVIPARTLQKKVLRNTMIEEKEEQCFSCKKANVCGSTSKEVEWVACNLCEK